MRILMVHKWPDAMRGSERSMHLAARALADRGHRVFLLHGQSLVPRCAADYDDVLGLPVLFETRKWPPAALPGVEANLRTWMRSRRIDAVHVHYPPRTDTMSRLARGESRVFFTAHAPLCPSGLRYLWRQRRACARRAGLGCIVSGYVEGDCGRLSMGTPYSFLSFARRVVDDHLFRTALRHLACVVAPSAWQKERLVKDGVPSHLLRVVHPPVVGAETSVDEATAHPELGNGLPLVTYVGHLSEAKGADHVLEMSVRVRTPHHVVFIGDGPLRAPLEEFAKRPELDGRVTFVGNLPPVEAQAHRLRSTVAVVPSLWPETFGMVGAEAMLAGRPVVAYDSGGVTEWLDDGVTGFTVPPGRVDLLAQAVERLLTAPDVARAMGLRGQAKARAWSPAEHARLMEEIFSSQPTTTAKGVRSRRWILG